MTFVILFLLNLTAHSTTLDIAVSDTIYPTHKPDSSLHKAIELEEVIVVGQRKLITMRKDTTFISTDSVSYTHLTLPTID